MKEPLDIHKLIKAVSVKHDKFIDSLGIQAEQVHADTRLRVERIGAKISFILNSFIDVGIIDKSLREKKGDFSKISISKNGSGNSIEIWMNGENIILTKSNFWIQSGCILKASPKKYFDNIDDDFDWINFSEYLLDYIHEVIYNRKDACEQKVKNSLGDI